ncbi:MAG TPA: hypothetical protein VK636_00505, partial [Gemmatimonadaceae bacterium]|nr:hypothetical protein [Gemmatimonadaceae bacterium]
MAIALIHAARPAIDSSGVSSGVATSASVAGLAVLGVIACAVAVLGGAVLLPVRYAQTRHAHG